jgi:Holliday junction resolvasome RuvABC DNA-binding subunit
LIVLCSGHHKLVHEELITITGTAPDQIAFTRDGIAIADRAPAAAMSEVADLRATARAERAQSQYASVATLIQAKTALRNLGYTARAAKDALDRACAQVGAGADVETLVKTALNLDRRAVNDPVIGRNELDQNKRMARQALVQAGFTGALAQQAVDSAVVSLGPEAELVALIKEALRHCRAS